MVYFGSEDGRLYAFAVGCANPHRACTPGWTAPQPLASTLRHAPTPTSLAIHSGRPSPKPGSTPRPPWPTASSTWVKRRQPLCIRDRLPQRLAVHTTLDGHAGAGIDSSPTVANGVVYVASRDGRLYAYAVGCANDGGTCTPLWSADIGGSSALLHPSTCRPSLPTGPCTSARTTATCMPSASTALRLRRRARPRRNRRSTGVLRPWSWRLDWPRFSRDVRHFESKQAAYPLRQAVRS